jgi:hypothetical protein
MSRQSRPRRIIAGEYNDHGYVVLLCSSTWVHTLYSAGNHPQDSQTVTPNGVGLRQIRGFCIRTCREIAGEHRAFFGGVSRVPENE